MPEHDANYSMRIGAIKRRFTTQYRQYYTMPTPINTSKIKRREATIWQRRFWEHFIRDEQDFQRHFDYLHFNPVKHGIVNQVSEWESSSFLQYVKLGFFDMDWGGNMQYENQNNCFGE
jgi:putative transposase